MFDIGNSKTSFQNSTRGWTLLLIQVLPVMAAVSLFPALPILFAHFQGTANAALLVPMIITVPSICIALFSTPAGWAIDRFGRRPILLIALALYFVSGMVPIVVDDLVLIVFSRALLGISEALIIPVGTALIADYFDEGRYKWLAWMSAVQSICGTLLIALGGLLADISWRGPFFIYLVTAPLFILSVFLMYEPERRKSNQEEKSQGRFPWKALIVIASVTFVSSILYYVEPLHISTLMRQIGIESSTRVGLIQALTSLAYIAGAFLYKAIYRRPAMEILGLAGVLIGVGMVGIGSTTEIVGMSIFAGIQQLGGGMVIPVLLAWGQSHLPAEQRGRGMGIWAMAFFTGQFLCSPITTWLAVHTASLQQSFFLLGALSVFLALATSSISMFRRRTTQ